MHLTVEDLEKQRVLICDGGRVKCYCVWGCVWRISWDVCLQVSIRVSAGRSHAVIWCLNSSSMYTIFRDDYQQSPKRICFTATNTPRLSLSLPAPSLPLGKISPCRQVHAPVAAKVPTCPPYARLHSASLLLLFPTRIRLAGPPQICSRSPHQSSPTLISFPRLPFFSRSHPLTYPFSANSPLLSHTNRWSTFGSLLASTCLIFPCGLSSPFSPFLTLHYIPLTFLCCPAPKHHCHPFA